MKKQIPDVGEAAPLFEVQNADGQTFQLSAALQSDRTILLAFYRGHW